MIYSLPDLSKSSFSSQNDKNTQQYQADSSYSDQLVSVTSINLSHPTHDMSGEAFSLIYS